MRKYKVTATQIAQDFNRRGIAPDWQHEVTQGALRLWRINNNLIPELYVGSDNGKSIPGAITGKYLYENTVEPQAIADDLIAENKLSKVDLGLIGAMPVSTAWLTTVEIEEKYDLPKSSVRRDIHRGKFDAEDIKKVGRDWVIKAAAADKLYKFEEVEKNDY